MKKKDSTSVVAMPPQNNAGLPVQPAQSVTPAERMIDMIFAAAHDKELDIDKLERLIALQERMLTDQRRAAFDDSMSRVQARITPVLQLGSRAEKQKGKFARYDDIKEMLRPILAEESMATSFSEVEKGEKKTKFVLKVSKGGHTESYFRTFSDDTASRNSQGVGIRPAIQDDGSTMSYAERYMTKMAFNIVEVGDDNDGEDREFIGPGQCARIRELLNETDTKEAEFLSMIAKVEKIEDISVKDFQRCLNALQTKLREKAKKLSQSGQDSEMVRQGMATNSGTAVKAARAATAPAAPSGVATEAPRQDKSRGDPTKGWTDGKKSAEGNSAQGGGGSATTHRTEPAPTADASGVKKPQVLTEKLLKKLEAAKTIAELQLIGEQCKTAPRSEQDLLRKVWLARAQQLEKTETPQPVAGKDCPQCGAPMDEGGYCDPCAVRAVSADADGELVCTDLQFDELTVIRQDREVPAADWYRFCKHTLGYGRSAELQQKNFQRAREWCETFVPEKK